MASQKNKNLPAKKASNQKSKLSKKAKRIIVVVSVVVMALLIIGGTLLIMLKTNDDNYKALAAQKKVVATCNGFDISYDELYFVTQLYKDSLEFSYGEGIWDDPTTAEKYRAELEALVMENLNENYLILSACKELSINTNASEKDAYIQKTMDQMMKEDFGGDKKTMIKALEDDGISERYMRFLIGIEYLHSVIYYTLDEVNAYTYSTSNIGDYIDYVMTSDKYAHTIHVYVENDAGESVEANRQKAENMYNYLMAEPDAEAREVLMREYIGSANNEDVEISEHGYYFTYGEMDEAYEEATFALSIGEVSKVLETSSGYYIIMRLAPNENYVTLNAQTLLSYYQSAFMGAYIERYDEDCQIVLNDYGKSLDLVKLEQFRQTKATAAE
ncbi:MAG: hypothetical protein E7661_03060 [Ruminococcaceae bacterium]|nr:hypothetical protein [Oscillospiraceae bacterium]